MKDIDYIRKEIIKIKRKLVCNNIRKGLFDVCTSPTNTEYPHIEFRGNEYHFVVTDRGTEILRKKTTDVKELIFWLVEPDIFELAITWELKHRVKSQDPRRVMFAKQTEFMEQACPEYVDMLKFLHQELLNKKPFNK